MMHHPVIVSCILNSPWISTSMLAECIIMMIITINEILSLPIPLPPQKKSPSFLSKKLEENLPKENF
jgi:hypothetical protein